MTDGPLGQYLDKKMEEKGLLVLGWGVNGLRTVTNNVRPIKTMADVKGLKIRLSANEVFMATFRSTLCLPRACLFSDVHARTSSSALK